MTCTEARKLISLQHDGIRVSPELRDHIAVCSSCQHYRSLLTAVFTEEEVHAPASLMENVMSRIEKKPSPTVLRRRRAMRIWLPVTAAAACAAIVISVVPAVIPKAGSAPKAARADCGEPEAEEEFFYEAAMETCEEEAPALFAEDNAKKVPADGAAGDAAEDETDISEYRATVTGPIPEDIPWEEHEDGRLVAFFTPAELRELEEAGVTVLCDVPPEELPEDVLVETVWDREETR